MALPNPSTSVTLLQQLRQTPGDRGAWTEFARRYGPAIFQWCRQRGVQDADADDVTQTVLLKLVARMKEFQYDPGGSFRAWLKTVTIHALSKFALAQQKAGLGSGGETDLLASVEARTDLAAKLEQEYDRELMDLAMVRVAQRVQPHTWEAFRLLAIEGLSGVDVAARLNLRVATAYVARSKVQKMIQDEVRAMDEGIV